MKTIPLTLTAMLLLGLTTATVAQNNLNSAERQMLKRSMSSHWSGEGSNLMVFDLIEEDTFCEGLGISKEQVQSIQDAMDGMHTIYENDPHLKPFQDELNKLMNEHGNPFAEDASDELRQKYNELQARRREKMTDVSTERMQNIINENLTSEQLKKFKEFQISIMSEVPIISPNMFEVLDLSDEQKKQLDAIKKEMEPEVDTMMDKLVDGQMKFTEIVQNAVDKKLEGVTDPEERARIQKEVQDEIRKSDPELQKAMREIMGIGKDVADKLKIKMFDVLTDEQWNRMIGLIDNPPEYAKKLLAQVHKDMGTDNSKSDEWQPGPNSWRPGDPIPEGYRQQRQERGKFPRNEQRNKSEPQAQDHTNVPSGQENNRNLTFAAPLALFVHISTVPS